MGMLESGSGSLVIRRHDDHRILVHAGMTGHDVNLSTQPVLPVADCVPPGLESWPLSR